VPAADQAGNDLQLGSGWPGCLLRREGELAETVSSRLAGTAMTALMAKFENITTGTRLTGLTGSGSATVESVQWIGEQALKVIYRDGANGLVLAD
jgi:hypothetical protein